MFMKIALLLTGDELMSGDIVDSNSAEMAQMFFEIGLDIDCKVTVGDDRQALAYYMEHLSKSHDVLIVNGGLGPTQDDLTAEILAGVAGLPLAEHPEALAHLQHWCAQRGFELSPANHKQAILPAGCSIVPNRRGSAVGFSLTLNNCQIITTPGVPSELRIMLREEIMPMLQAHAQDGILFDKMMTFGLGESRIQQMVSDQLAPWPSALDLGFRAGMPLLEVKLRSHNQPELHQEYLGKLKSLLGDHVVAEGRGHLPTVVVELLKQRGESITTAESCTGGRIASDITSVAGSSAVFEAGFVTYSNAMKTTMLGVSPSTLERHGAVSQQVVEEMVNGALDNSGATWGIAVSGIAGPDGGSEEKPVGTVWMAWGKKDNIKTQRLHLRFDRNGFQRLATAICLDLIRRELLGIERAASYFDRYTR